MSHHRSLIDIVRAFLLLILLFSLTFSVSQPSSAQSDENPDVTEDAPVQVITEEPTEAPPPAEEVIPVPTEIVTEEPTSPPTQEVTPEATEAPTDEATPEVTEVPTDEATPEATEAPTDEATPEVTEAPTDEATPEVTSEPVVLQIMEADNPAVFQSGVWSQAADANASAGSYLTSSGSTADILTLTFEGSVLEIVYMQSSESGIFAVEIDGAVVQPVNAQADTSAFAKVSLDVSSDNVHTLRIVPLNGVVGIDTFAAAGFPSAPEVTPEATAEAAPTINELLIDYNPNASQADIDALLAALGAVELERIPQIGVMRIQVPAQYAEPTDALNALNTYANLALAAGTNYIEENGLLELMYVPNDTYYEDYQWALNTFYGLEAEDAWDLAPKRGRGVIVAVLDSGVDVNHPDLRGQLVPGWNFGEDNNNPDDAVVGHGTHVAGIIGARTNNNLGVAGIAFNAKIMPLKITTFGTNNAFWFDVAGGIVYAVDHGAKVINMSLGSCNLSTTSQYPQSIWGAMSYADARNVVVVMSAGNGNGQTGCTNTNYNILNLHPAVISVAATDIDGISAGINRGFNANDRIDVAAPGISILSTYPLEFGGYNFLGGTSMASPYVAGVAALLIGEGIATTPDEVREALTCTAWDLGTLGKDNYYGYGLVQADWALGWRADTGCDIIGRNDRIENSFAITRLPYVNVQPVDFRSAVVDPNDPVICGGNPGTNRVQTFWYQFTPKTSGFYQFATDGSSYDTVVGVFAGQPNILRQVSCNDDGGSGLSSFLSTSLEAKQTYYIVISTFGPTNVDGQIMRLDMRPIFATGKDIQENLLGYSRNITPSSLVGASGGKVAQLNAGDVVFFSFRGTSFDLVTSGSLDVYIDNVLQGTLNNPGLTVNSFATGGLPGRLLNITLVATGPAALDRVKLYDAVMRPIAGLKDDRDPNIFFNGLGWADLTSADNYRTTITATNSAGNFMEFKGRGSAFIIRRNLTPTSGNMDVFVDGRPYSTFSNFSAFNLYSIPLVISDLSNTEHTIRVTNVNNASLEIDAVEVAVPAALRTGRPINDTDRNIRYNGESYSIADNSALGRTLRYLYEDGEAHFKFSGNWFCIGYDDGGTVNVYVDSLFYGAFNAAGGGEWCTDWLSTNLHHVRIQQAGSFLALDYVTPLQAALLSPTTNRGGIIQETDKAFLYSYNIINGRVVSDWTAARGAPAGVDRGRGRFQGAAKRTFIDGANVTFWINGSGFVLYTSVQTFMGSYDIYVDGVYYRTLDLWSGQTDPWQPLALGVIDLTPGIHRIELRAETYGDTSPVDFDGLRVIP